VFTPTLPQAIMAKQLTAAAVQRLRPSKVRREIRDGGCPGLYLIIQSTGHKSWALRFRRPGGKPAKLTLGPADFTGREGEGEPVLGAPLTLASARRLAIEFHRQRALGKDVVALRHRERLERETRGAKTFAAAAATIRNAPDAGLEGPSAPARLAAYR
jgi:hypothetical protein